MLTVLIAAYWLHLQGSVVHFFIGYLTFEDEATVWSQTGAKQTPSFRVHCPSGGGYGGNVIRQVSDKGGECSGNGL